MTGTRHRIVGYHQYGVVGARELQAYRGNLLWSLISMAVQIALLAIVWTAIYSGRTTIDGVDLSTMVTYVTLVNIQFWLLMYSSRHPFAERVRDGKVAVDLCRPIGVFAQVVAGQAGRAVAMLPFAALAVPLGMLAGELRPPASALAGAVYVVSLVLAFGIATFVGTALVLTAFWTLEVGGLQFIYRYVSQFFAGGLVPLWFMPDWLRVTAEILPFQAIAYTPVSVYLGRLAGADLVRALAFQGLWLLATHLLGRLIWRRALHKVVIQGG